MWAVFFAFAGHVAGHARSLGRRRQREDNEASSKGAGGYFAPLSFEKYRLGRRVSYMPSRRTFLYPCCLAMATGWRAVCTPPRSPPLTNEERGDNPPCSVRSNVMLDGAVWSVPHTALPRSFPSDQDTHHERANEGYHLVHCSVLFSNKRGGLAPPHSLSFFFSHGERGLSPRSPCYFFFRMMGRINIPLVSFLQIPVPASEGYPRSLCYLF